MGGASRRGTGNWPGDTAAWSAGTVAWPALADCFSVDQLTGTFTASIPLPLSRTLTGSPCDPQLELRYDHRAGDSSIGVGWACDVPSIECVGSAAQGDERYRYDGRMLVRRTDGKGVDLQHDVVGEYTIERFMPEFEATFDLIEKWSHPATGNSHWRVVDKGNVVSLFGNTDNSRVLNRSRPAQPRRWLIGERYDDLGNVCRYKYKGENDPNGEDVHLTDHQPNAAKYLKQISYGNKLPYDRSQWHFEVVFDYGDHDEENPQLQADGVWVKRQDPYVRRDVDLEETFQRTLRRVLMFHSFDELGPHPSNVWRVQFGQKLLAHRTVLTSIDLVGVLDRGDGAVESVAQPSMTFTYNQPSTDIRHDPSERESTRRTMPQIVDVLTGRQATDVGASFPLEHRARADPMVSYVDINGDDADDVVVSDGDAIRWYPSIGESGFGDAVVFKPYESPAHLDGSAQSSGPLAVRLRANDRQTIHVADMTGDGRPDLVRARPGEIAYWPNKGDGTFGSEVQVAVPVDVDLPATATPAFVSTPDPGTGSSVVWFHDGNVTVWKQTRLDYFEHRGRVAVAHAHDGRTHAIQLFDRAPFAMNEAQVAGIAKVTASYDTVVASDREYLPDARRHSVSVVASVDFRDLTTSVKRSESFAYQGAVSSGEGDATVFRCVTRSEGDTSTEAISDGGANLYKSRVSMVEKSWFHTGEVPSASNNRHTDGFFDDFEQWTRLIEVDTSDPVGSGASSVKVSLAHRGAIDRRELYVEGSPIPLKTTHFLRRASVIQRARNPGGWVLASQLDAEISVVHEQKKATPRVSVKATLERDHFGHPVVSVELNVGDLSSEYEFQRSSLAFVTMSDVESVITPTVYRHGVNVGQREWSATLSGAPTITTIVDALDELRTKESSDTRSAGEVDWTLVSWRRSRYWNRDFSEAVPLSSASAKALEAYSERLVLTGGDVRRHLAELDDTLIEDAFDGAAKRHSRDELGWWRREAEIRYAPAHFFASTELVKRLAKRQYNPRVLLRWAQRDGSATSVERFDPLGRVRASAICGDGGDFMDMSSCEASSADDPTEVLTYGLGGFDLTDGSPQWVHRRRRDVHGESVSSIFDCYEFVDAAGNLVCRSAASGDKWRVDLFFERDSHGNVLAEYLPFETEEPWPTDIELASAPKSIHWRDAIGRIVCTEHVGGSLAAQSYGPWWQRRYDKQDLVFESTWFAYNSTSSKVRAGEYDGASADARYRSLVASQTALLAGLPSIELLDAAGRVVGVSRSGKLRESRAFGQSGLVTEVRGPDGILLESRQYDTAGQVLLTRDGDRTAISLHGDNGSELLRHSASDRTILRRYDASNRLTHVYLVTPEGKVLMEHLVWPADRNATAPSIAMGQDGVHITRKFNVVGLPLEVEFRPFLPTSNDGVKGGFPFDWTPYLPVSSARALGQTMVEHATAQLLGPPLRRRMTYDSVGNVTTEEPWDGLAVSCAHDCGGRVQAVTTSTPGASESNELFSVQRSAFECRETLSFGPSIRMNRLTNESGSLMKVTVESLSEDHSSEPQCLSELRVVRDIEDRVVAVSDESNLIMSLTYDGAGALVRYEGVDGESDRFSHAYERDELGQVRRVESKVRSRATADRVMRARNNVTFEALGRGDKGAVERYVHDADGNLVAGPSHFSYTWDPLGRLVAVEAGSGAAARFAYDFEGRLSVMHVMAQDSATLSVFDGSCEYRTVTDADGRTVESLRRMVVEFEGMPLCEISQRMAPASRSNGDGHRAFDGPFDVKYLIGDQFGSVVAEFDQSGHRISSETFSVFGESIEFSAKSRSARDAKLGFMASRHRLASLLVWTDNGWFMPSIGYFLAPLSSERSTLRGPFMSPALWQQAHG